MLERIQTTFKTFMNFILWILLAILATLTAFQLHATLIFLAILVIENPSLRPTYWSMDSLHGLGRVLWLVIGVLWLGWVMFTEGYFREGKHLRVLRQRAIRCFLITGGIYLLCVIILRLLA
jgi:hypothetical protein